MHKLKCFYKLNCPIYMGVYCSYSISLFPLSYGIGIFDTYEIHLYRTVFSTLSHVSDRLGFYHVPIPFCSVYSLLNSTVKMFWVWQTDTSARLIN